MLWFGLLIGGSIGVIKWAETPQEETKSATPGSSLRHDVLLTVFTGLLFGSASGIALGLAFDAILGAALGITSGLMIGLIAGLVAAVIFGSGGASFVYWLSAGQLRARYGLPKRPMNFLEDARRLGLLRGNGMVYQFRNSDLRDRLASRYTG
jgi:uncharacterized membrane protein